MTLEFPGIQIPAGGGENHYIDLSQVCSLVNRRFYRQGINWAVAGFKILSVDTVGTPSGIVSLRKLPNTWVMSNAWEKSFRTWQRMNNEALSEAESIRPKFLDFKIYADAQHHQLGFDGNLLPDSFDAGEWEASKIYIPKALDASAATTNDFELIATGANFPGVSPITGLNAVSLIEGYAASRALPNVLDPNAPADADSANGNSPQNWMSALFNSGTTQTTEVLDDMLIDNNKAPYPFEGDGTNIDTQYPNGANQGPGMQIHDYEFITGTTIGGATRLKGGNFPAGLMKFTFANTSTNEQSQCSYFIYIDLVPGNHRGYLCEPMTEM